ncbi:MAG: hypothetical protein ASARMPREDX12_003070 [Alectoria sarmentosa]|nr:MAG: hypothetical protein ASARMPREDX12_003070 [Alectoria sarmentosa]
MGREEQIEEREVLDSIFPDEITDISETSYRVSIALEPTPASLILTVVYPESYPDVAPNLDITFPQNTPRMPQLSLPEDKPHLLSSIDETISESMGQAMVFTLISALKESAELLIGERLKEVQAERDKEAAKVEEAENAKFHGEAVTRESFLGWRAKFRDEMVKSVMHIHALDEQLVADGLEIM